MLLRARRGGVTAAGRAVVSPHERSRITRRAVATAMRYLSTIVGCACLLLAAICIAIACQVFI
ncbi:hypothetical protein HAP41_0000027760 [Bradyrhizobium barranii subsp. apii]|uniref:Uncharacterized protein n=1 Tax=Bradyrhizobium barranii subsp. apii TaxID=2819348 RepID=A0A8T5VET8_9BRAD|nr:hypothetical protein [Bradyrhizobium barranii]UPT84172.1 hypothetical protein HAP41_0000027760 [Bradyrhizobium barranii subsp. apii]UPU00470.1 hypothetical protein J4G48_0021670 [Bradyrhizobium barranii subsp. apii]